MADNLEGNDEWRADPMGEPVRASINAASRRQPFVPPLPFKWFSDITPNLKGMWLVKRLLPATGLALIYGHPGSGKSFLALDLALHIALGWDWSGRKTKQGLVVYVAAEGGMGLENRVAAFRAHHNLFDSVSFALIPCPIDLQDPGADTEKLIAEIKFLSDASTAAPVFVVIDTLSKTFGGGKENTDDMAIYIANCQRVASTFNCLVMPVHHRPKDAESIEPRGHGSLKGGVDTVILVEGGRTKSAEVTKQKDGEIGDRFLFDLQVCELGEDEDGDPVTSCVLRPTDFDLTPKLSTFATAVAKLSAGPRLVYDQLGGVIEHSGEPIPTEIPDSEINRAAVSRVAHLDAWRDNSISAGGTGAGHSRDTAKRQFNRALKTLQSRGVVGVWNDWAWITHQISGHDRDMLRDVAGTSGQPGHGSLDPVTVSRPSCPR